MGQDEVFQFLKDHPEEWFSCKEISQATCMSYGSITTSMKRLRECGEVLFTGSGHWQDEYRYRYRG